MKHEHTKLHVEQSLIDRGIVDADGTVILPVREGEPMCLLLVNGQYLVSIGDTEGCAIDDQVWFNLHTGDNVAEALSEDIFCDGHTDITDVQEA